MTEDRTIKCKECGADMPAGSVFCDKCGASLSSHGEEKKAGKSEEPKQKTEKKSKEKLLSSDDKSNLKVLIIIAAVLIAIFTITSIALNLKEISDNSGGGRTDLEKFDDIFDGIQVRVTPEQYESLNYGMSYSEVVDLLGEDGAAYYSNSYYWPGVLYGEPEYSYRYESPYIYLVFSDSDRLIEISEHNLMYAEEILENRVQEKGTKITINEEMLSSIKNGMSFEEVSEILGEPGILIESESNKKGYSELKYEWRYREESDPVDVYFAHLEIRFVDGKAQRDSYSIWGK